MREGRITKSRTIAMILSAALVIVMASTSFASAAVMNLDFNKAGELPGAVQNSDKFYSSQGFAFDTDTKEDAYAFTLNNARTKGTLTHMKYENGEFTREKKVTYTKFQIGHANDLTVFKKGNQKYIFVAKGGVNGKKEKITKEVKKVGMIKLSDFNKGKAKIYPVKLNNLNNKSGTDIRGIAYVGKKVVPITSTVKKKGKKVKVTKKVKKDVFIVQAGRRINKMYLKSINGKTAVFQGVDNQRIKAPEYEGREGTANGICYHNGTIYCAYADEGDKGKNQTAMIDGIGFNKLFATKNSNTAVKFPLKFVKNFAQEENEEVFTTESVSFTSLEGKGNMFMTCNGGSDVNHRDFIYMSNEKR